MQEYLIDDKTKLDMSGCHHCGWVVRERFRMPGFTRSLYVIVLVWNWFKMSHRRNGPSIENSMPA
jgi:hypothetical protein